MSSEYNRPDMKYLWQNQTFDGTSMSLDELRNAFVKLNRIERRRRLISVLFCLMFVGAFGVLLIMAAPIPIVHSGEVFFAIGAGFFFYHVIFGLRRAPGKLLTQGEPEACATFYGSVLERQRKFYRRSALWVPLFISACLLPVIILMPPIRLIMIALWVLLVPFWVYESMNVARSSQRELDKLNARFR